MFFSKVFGGTCRSGFSEQRAGFTHTTGTIVSCIRHTCRLVTSGFVFVRLSTLHTLMTMSLIKEHQETIVKLILSPDIAGGVVPGKKSI